jgi:hypothetical protein
MPDAAGTARVGVGTFGAGRDQIVDAASGTVN